MPRPPLTAACAGHDPRFGDDPLETHAGEARVAQRELPELRRGRVLATDAKTIPGEVHGDSSPAGGPPAGERRHLVAEYLTVTPGGAAAGLSPVATGAAVSLLAVASAVVQPLAGRARVEAGAG